MSISATPSTWNAVEIAMRGRKRSSAHSSTVLRLVALELDRQLAGLQLVEQPHTSAISPAASSSYASRSTPARDLGDARPSCVRRQASREAGNDSPSRRPSSHAADQPLHGRPRARRSAPAGIAASRSRRRRRARRGRRCRTPDGASPLSSRAVVPWKPRSATQCCAHACGQPSSCSRRSAMSPPNRPSRCVDQPAEPRLRLGDREVAVRLARAADRAAAQRG